MLQNSVPLSVTVSQKNAPARAAMAATIVNQSIIRGDVTFLTRLMV